MTEGKGIFDEVQTKEDIENLPEKDRNWFLASRQVSIQKRSNIFRDHNPPLRYKVTIADIGITELHNNWPSAMREAIAWMNNMGYPTGEDND